MTIYKIKIPGSQADKFAAFLAAFCIRVVLCYAEETLFGNDLIATVSDEPSEGISSEEKSRLITDKYERQIQSIYQVDPATGAAKKLSS